jgi:hypothetical protein
MLFQLLAVYTKAFRDPQLRRAWFIVWLAYTLNIFRDRLGSHWLLTIGNIVLTVGLAALFLVTVNFYEVNLRGSILALSGFLLVGGAVALALAWRCFVAGEPPLLLLFGYFTGLLAGGTMVVIAYSNRRPK